jgi:hypothetical protein
MIPRFEIILDLDGLGENAKSKRRSSPGEIRPLFPHPQLYFEGVPGNDEC